jgi:kynurenine formamidase
LGEVETRSGQTSSGAPEWPDDDEMFDVEAVQAGSWGPGPYGPMDELGTFNEVTPQTTTAALRLLDLSRSVRTYDLSETLFNDFPAFGDRAYRQELLVTGYQSEDDVRSETTSPEVAEEEVAKNRPTFHEERVSLTYNMGTKINGLAHAGVGGTFYNAYRGAEIRQPWGVTRLAMEKVTPIVTRGILVDVVGYKVVSGATGDYFVADNGRPILVPNYRITVEDIEAALEWEGFPSDPAGPGDAVLLRTGWRELIGLDPDRYVHDLPPGPFLRECRYLARRRPAIIGIDVWCFGTMDRSRDDGNPACCHQELAGRYGIHVGEGIRSDGLADDEIYEFVFCCNPTNARGAVASNAPPMALGQPSVG